MCRKLFLLTCLVSALGLASANVAMAKDPVPADGTAGVSTAPVISTFVSDDVPKNVPQAYGNSPRGVTSTLIVADSITIKDLNVELDIQMLGNNADLNVYLTAPDGKKVELFTDISGRTDIFGPDDCFTNTILDDEASTSITDGRHPFTGIYRPEESLSAFDGRDTAGEWKLRVEDDWNIIGTGETATLNSWRIVVENPILINWTPAGGAASQDVYFSEKFDDVSGIGDPGFLANVPAGTASFDVGALGFGTTYYWRVDSIADDGSVQAAGDVWKFTTASGNIVTSTTPGASSDDYEEQGDDGTGESLDSSDLQLVYEGNVSDGVEQVVGIRFVDLMAPNIITQAYVQFDADDVDNSRHEGDAHILIEGELSPDPVTFAQKPFNITSRPRTAAVVPWSPARWMATHLRSPDEATSDISSIVQEIVDQDGWAAGNSLVLIFSADPGNPSTGMREPESFDGAGGNVARRPTLHILGIGEFADNPSPADAAVDVAQDVVLGWSPGFTGVSRDVYFGTESKPPKLERTTGTSYVLAKLAISTTYYWRIDEYDADGAKHDGKVWSFTTVRGEGTNPDPADYAAGVPMDAVLSWTPGATAVSSDIYFGTDSPPAFMGTTAETSFDPALLGGLVVGETYYWRIDSIEEDGTTYVGDVWTFTVRPAPPVPPVSPVLAYDPSPADGAENVGTSVSLNWAPGLGAMLHSVYFGDDLETVTNAVGAPPLPPTTFDPGPLEPGKTYYWRVAEFPPTYSRGTVWSFTTAP